MLDKTSVKILRYLYDQPDYITETDIEKLLGNSSKDCLDSLAKDHYLKSKNIGVVDKSKDLGVRFIAHYKIDTNGKAYLENHPKEALKSFAPIIISVLALAISILSWLFPRSA